MGLEWNTHVLTWYVLSGVLMGVLHIAIYVCGISIVRYSWSSTCSKRKRRRVQSSVGDGALVSSPQNGVHSEKLRRPRPLSVVHSQCEDKDSKEAFVQRALIQSQKHYM